MSGHHEDIIFTAPDEWIFRWEIDSPVQIHRVVHFGTFEWYDLDDARFEQIKAKVFKE